MSQKKRPNIMLLQAEDVGLHLHCYPGNEYSHTPHLDQLASEGIRYTQAFTHSPVCAPSRGGMVTGCYPWTIGNHLMRSTLLNPPRTMMHEFRDAGYKVSWPTKLDFNFEPTEGWCTDQANWWEEDAPDQPFFVYQNFGKTHESQLFGDFEAWNKTHPVLPEGVEHHAADAPVPPYVYDCPEARESLVKYYDALTDIDREIGERLKWLKEQGKADNTIVVFLSDHGRGMPREKRWCYEAGHHMPLLVRWPESIDSAQVRDELIAWVDIAPTLLSLAGLEIPDHYQGQVFLGEDQAEPRDHVLGGRDRMGTVYDSVRMVRDQRWHYIRNYFPELPWAQFQWYAEATPVVPLMRKMHQAGELTGAPALFFSSTRPVEELYDIEQDPDCLNNLAALEEHATVLALMRQRLAAHHDEYDDFGFETEEALIDQGLITDRIPEYKTLSAEKQEEFAIEGPMPPLTMAEAKAQLGLA